MSDKVMTLKERFDFHMGEVDSFSRQAEHVYGDVPIFEPMTLPQAQFVDIYMKQAQLHATLALAVAQRMTAKALEDEAQARRTGG